ncbi:DUF2271 domain-containing protein [Flexithrix dorotheae]|uniref:DUF2271 domain-containing protein n=1 Tax=Flexithrix dorotheae TaxID=70993 RepID=UPI00038098B4|nr:DUF2271 domain-containing protein [Flexithrix dorotheae]
MYKIAGLILLLIAPFIMSWSTDKAEKTSASYKCLVQLTNYKGEGAYLVVSLINPEGQYEKTLYVIGQDAEWYPDMTQWWSFYDPKPTDIDAISGATIAGGERTICVIDIDEDKLNAGYKLRFETAVEDQEYVVDDVEFPLTSENVTGKFEGKGYIRYIRIMPN